MASEPTAVLFDLDGTLIELPVDIEPARRAVEELLAEAGQGGPARPILAAIDRASAALAVRSGEAAGRELRARARAILDAAELEAAHRARAKPGAAAAVTALVEAGRTCKPGALGPPGLALGAPGTPLAIVTDNGRACLAPALAAAGLDGFPWHAVTRDDVTRPKPAPDGIAAAARALCPDGGAIWMIGDSPRDVEAARAAATALGPAFRVRVAAAPGAGEAVRRAGPDHILDRLDAVAALVAAG
jgi:phosphoglycolate phosphatase-like HAD superfamily hydrolase